MSNFCGMNTQHMFQKIKKNILFNVEYHNTRSALAFALLFIENQLNSTFRMDYFSVI